MSRNFPHNSLTEFITLFVKVDKNHLGIILQNRLAWIAWCSLWVPPSKVGVCAVVNELGANVECPNGMMGVEWPKGA